MTMHGRRAILDGNPISRCWLLNYEYFLGGRVAWLAVAGLGSESILLLKPAAITDFLVMQLHCNVGRDGKPTGINGSGPEFKKQKLHQ